METGQGQLRSDRDTLRTHDDEKQSIMQVMVVTLKAFVAALAHLRDTAADTLRASGEACSRLPLPSTEFPTLREMVLSPPDCYLSLSLLMATYRTAALS